MGTTIKLQDNFQATETVCDSTCVHNKTVIIIMQICKLPTYQTICERISCRKGLVQLHILTSATVTCCFNLSAASFSLLTKNALTFPAPQCFCENGTYVLLATMLATVGAQKVLFAQLVKHTTFSFRGWT